MNRNIGQGDPEEMLHLTGLIKSKFIEERLYLRHSQSSTPGPAVSWSCGCSLSSVGCGRTSRFAGHRRSGPPGFGRGVWLFDPDSHPTSASPLHLDRPLHPCQDTPPERPSSLPCRCQQDHDALYQQYFKTTTRRVLHEGSIFKLERLVEKSKFESFRAMF